MYSNHEITAALKTCNVVGETVQDNWLSPLRGGAAPPRGCDGAAQANGKVDIKVDRQGGGGGGGCCMSLNACIVFLLL